MGNTEDPSLVSFGLAGLVMTDLAAPGLVIGSADSGLRSVKRFSDETSSRFKIVTGTLM